MVNVTGKFIYKYSGYSDCIQQSVAADGYRVFGQGLNATLLRAFPTNAATFTVSLSILPRLNTNYRGC